MKRYLLPIVAIGIFVVIALFLFKRLADVNRNLEQGKDPREIASPLIGKAAPNFSLPLLYEPDKKLSPQDMKGKVWLLNVWASWCGSCKEEHPVLMDLSRQNILPIVGVDYKDRPEDGVATLKRGGDPYTSVIVDADGKAFFDYGVYGVPESYLIDKQGVIRYKLTGVISMQNWNDTLLPLVRELQSK